MATIQVTDQDIRYGCRGSNRFDPVGNALHRQGFHNPTVSKKSVRLPDGREFSLPDNAIRRIDAWDKGLEIGPFKFELSDGTRLSS